MLDLRLVPDDVAHARRVSPGLGVGLRFCARVSGHSGLEKNNFALLLLLAAAAAVVVAVDGWSGSSS